MSIAYVTYWSFVIYDIDLKNCRDIVDDSINCAKIMSVINMVLNDISLYLKIKIYRCKIKFIKKAVVLMLWIIKDILNKVLLKKIILFYRRINKLSQSIKFNHTRINCGGKHFIS